MVCVDNIYPITTRFNLLKNNSAYEETYKIDILSTNTEYLKPITNGLVSWVNYEDYSASTKTIVDRITNKIISCECVSNGIYDTRGIDIGSLPAIKTIECNGMHRDTTANENGTTLSGCTIFYGNANGVTLSCRCRTNDKYSYCDNIIGRNFFYNTPYQNGWQNDLNSEGLKNEYLNGGLFYCSLKSNVKDIPLNFGYFPHGGVTLNRYKDILVYDRELTDEEIQHNKMYHRLRSLVQNECLKSTQSILLPQPLNKIGDLKDKFYWDDDKGHYCIEQSMISITPTEDDIVDSLFKLDGYYTFAIKVDNVNAGNLIGINSYGISLVPYASLSGLNKEYISFGNEPSLGQICAIVRIKNSRASNKTELLEYFKSNKFTLVYKLATPKIIDLPHLNKKYSLDTYMPTTYVECTNNPMQPSRLLLESDTVRYKPSSLEADTDYTIQFECKEKSDKKVKLNLGGSEKEVDAIVGLNHVSITTPSEIDTSLYKDRLFLSGVGNKVADVIVAKGEMNQYPNYFNGEQSTGELQDDGTYLIGIKTNEGFNVSIQTNNALAKGDKLYWNKSNKRYEIDRGGSIEVPTVSGDVIDLPRLYQREDTHFSTSTGNIKPSKIKIDYNDLD